MVAVGALFGLLAFVRWIQRRVETIAAADPELVDATLVVPSLMQGGQSESGNQLNGNGVLALFPDEVRFVVGVPHRTMTIPRAAITSVTVTKHLKLPGMRRAGGPPWLMVVWTGQLGAQSTGFQTSRAPELVGLLVRAGPPGATNP